MTSIGKRISAARASVESGASAASDSVCHWMGLVGNSSNSVLWVMRAVLLVYASFVASNLPANSTWLFDNTVARLVVVLLILALAMCDPASAILLTIGFVLSIQAANKQHISKLANVATTAAASAGAPTETFMARAVDHLPADADAAVSTLAHVPMDTVNTAATTVSAASHVATNTASAATSAVTGQLHAHGAPSHGAAAHTNSAHGNAQLFTNSQQFNDIQSNSTGADPNTEVRTWNNSFSTQGLAEPRGYDSGNSGCSPAPLSQQ